MTGPVIVGVEGSDRSRAALALGRQLADGLGVELVAAYVHPYAELAGLLEGGPAGEALQLIDELAESAHASVRKLTEELNIEELRLTSASSAAAGLQALAEEAGAGLVALGSSRRSGLERVLPGGTAERLLSGCSAAVAVAPGNYSKRGAAPRVLGGGFDGSPMAHEALVGRRTGGSDGRLPASHSCTPTTCFRSRGRDRGTRNSIGRRRGARPPAGPRRPGCCLVR
jgi:nucleotide-binding universal stress UspA family protein